MLPEMSDEEEDGQEIREFAFVFETHTEITKAWKKEVRLTNGQTGGPAIDTLVAPVNVSSDELTESRGCGRCKIRGL